MNENLKETLINLKERVNISKREEERRFILIFLALTAIYTGLCSLYYILSDRCQSRYLASNLIGYVAGIVAMSLVFCISKKKTESPTGTNHFKRHKERLLSAKKCYALNAFVNLESILNKLEYEDIYNSKDFDGFLNMLNTEKYKQFKDELSVVNHKAALLLNNKEECFREILNEISMIKELREKDLKNLY